MNTSSSFATSRLPSAHDRAASARAAAKREERRLAIANRPRGQTQIVGHREDGSPVYRAIAAFRARPYVTPEERAKREERGALPIAGMRSVDETVEAAQWADEPHEHGRRYGRRCPGDPYCNCDSEVVDLPRDAKRAARKVRMATKRRRWW